MPEDNGEKNNSDSEQKTAEILYGHAKNTVKKDKSINASHFHILRDCYYELTINHNETVWQKKLRNILVSDIHLKPLGCHIEDAHIKIGSLHYGAFYEAQILFSHAKWVSRFSDWLKMKQYDHPDTLIVGYETYIEPVLINLENHKENIKYCVYEEPRYETKDRIRYFKHVWPDTSIVPFKNIVFLCGISTSLSTHQKMYDKIISMLPDQKIPKPVYCSLIQILPKITENDPNRFKLNDNEELRWDRENKTITKYNTSNNSPLFTVSYLIDVECEMHLANECEWCEIADPDHIQDERPLIKTEDVSVIPTQMIGSNAADNTKDSKKGNRNAGYSIFFDTKDTEKGLTYLYQEYLYYDHIERSDHHYNYYIRTGSLLLNLVESDNSAFNDFCNKIKKELENRKDKRKDDINIIVAPLHFSNSRFPHEINKRVFQSTAHEITFDPRKEFRSNFESKYSNYAYALEQIKRSTGNGNERAKIHFFYVDDEIITGYTFYRAKSFVSSLMRPYRPTDKNTLDNKDGSDNKPNDKDEPLNKGFAGCNR